MVLVVYILRQINGKEKSDYGENFVVAATSQLEIF